jgi:signal transduction histidine kinase
LFTDTISSLRIELSNTSEALHRSEERATAGQLALEVIHEVRNIAEVLGNVTFLWVEDVDDPIKHSKHMRFVEEQVAMLSQVASHTMSFASGSQKTKPSDLVALTEAALRIHQKALEAKDIVLVKDFPAALIADVHGVSILQVVSNLLKNALEALPVRGTLRIRLRQREKHIHFVVADNGHGIPQKYAQKVFHPFFTTKEELGGTGLGLALSRKIIERHKGTIRLRSSVLAGKSGTTFKISFPSAIGPHRARPNL